MRLPHLVDRALRAVAVLSLLAGCSGRTSQALPGQTLGAQALSSRTLSSVRYRPMVVGGAMSVLPEGFTAHAQRPAWMKAPPPGASKAHVAVAQFGASDVLWFPEKDKKNTPPAVCEPASSTNGIRVDRKGNLWIPDGRADTVTEYAPNCGASELTIQDTTGEPADVAFDQQGLVYVLNINDISGPPTIEVYNRHGKHVRTLGDPSFSVLFGVGTDSHGNIFASNLTSNNVGNVVEFPGGKMPGTALTGVALGLPGTPAFDRSDNLVISDWFHLTIDVFAPPYTGAPTTSALRGSSIWCPLDRHEKFILCGDADFGSIDVYGYPGGAYLYSYTSGLSPSALVTGVAPAPPAPF
jgi:hypothetical protein